MRKPLTAYKRRRVERALVENNQHLARARADHDWPMVDAYEAVQRRLIGYFTREAA